MKYLLAIDCGGSKAEAILTGMDGSVVSHGYCDAFDPESGRHSCGSGRSQRSLAVAVRRALDGHAPGDLHVASCGTDGGELPEGWRRIMEPIYVGEQIAPMALSGSDVGVIVLAGTGAFVYARNHAGHARCMDGMGPLLGDYGSACHIGYLALRAAVRSSWHPRHKTALEERVPESVRNWRNGNPEIPTVGLYPQSPDRGELAALALLVDQEAEKGDGICRAILEQAALAISETVRDTVWALDMTEGEYPMIATGSVATNSRIYWEHMCECVRGFAPGLRPIVPDLPPVFGVALVAHNRLSGDDKCVGDRLKRTGLDFMRAKNTKRKAS